ncbi:acid phosphatase 1-like isoform X1 [Panicum miliaceum]|uniref:Acid phosphatase 1-like isoform X1 n=1 Tax=Panicum miliaceum TaxID=4540 RepID=A0A3L6PEW9_PANMI|nr:acid phosphatase 1-like isoform X1 [Panicum miliaceum]
MARRGGLVRLLVTLILLLLAALLAAASAVAEAATATAEVEVELAPAAPAQNASEEAEQPQHLLPRPLIIELPSSAPARAAGAEEVLGERRTRPRRWRRTRSSTCRAPLVIDLPSSSAAGPRDGDDVPEDVRCARWRLAAEANNLAPWKAVPAECAAHVQDYVTGVAYRSDLELVARESAAYARAAPLRGDGRDAWVFDVDETLLSNLPYYADHGYGLELFDHQKFDRWVERGEARAIPSSLKLYNEVRELGFKTFLLTGRSEGHQGVTMENLKKQGFHDWDRLILSCPALVLNSEGGA